MVYFGQDKISELHYSGTEIKEMYLGNTMVFQNKHPLFLTLETDGHGTLSADVLSGFEGDTVTLTPTYNTYYRFSGYQVTGGTIAGNTFTFGTEDATAKANFSGNAFTASGTFEALTANYSVKDNGYGTEKTGNIPQMNAITSYHTSNVPASWYNTSNRWKPTNPANYSITLNPVLKYNVTTGAYAGTVTAGVIARIMVGSTANQQATSTRNSPGNGSYNKTFTTTAYNVNYGLSGRQTAKGRGGGQYTTCTCYVFMSATTGTQNGTWTATGYAP